jgi:hypothetical protein
MFQVKYLKYKNKYLALKNKMTGGASAPNPLLDFIKNDKSPRMNYPIHPEIQKEHNKQIEEAKIIFKFGFIFIEIKAQLLPVFLFPAFNTSIDEEAKEVKVTVDDREIVYDYSDLDEIVHAYAVSIHKSQGSEYPAVVIPILTQHYVLLQRNLLYTGVTRGKKLVVIVGSKRAMAIAVKNNKTEKRFTLLKQRLSRN